MAKFFWNLIHGRSNMDKTSDPERLCLIHDALAIQEMFLKRKILGVPPNDEYQFLLFVEHDRAYVCTKKDEEMMKKPGGTAKLFRPNMGSPNPHLFMLAENRGGSITYHGPGQLTCYMILCEEEVGIKNPHHIAAIIDEAVKDFLSKFGVTGYTIKELCKITDSFIREKLISQGVMSVDPEGKSTILMPAQGVWVIDRDGAKKIASRGIRRVTHTYPDGTKKHFLKHGFAVNLYTELEYFDYIYPCGEDIQMTSLEKIAQDCPPVHKAAPIMAKALRDSFRKLTDDKSHELV